MAGGSEAGLPWPVEAAARVPRAARLAGQIKDALRSVAPKDWRPERLDINVENPKQPGFWVWFDQTPVLWGLHAHLNRPGEPSDDEKSRALVDKARQDGGLKPLGPDEYLDGGDRMEIRAIR